MALTLAQRWPTLDTLNDAADDGIRVGGVFLLSDGIIAAKGDLEYRTLNSQGWATLRKDAVKLEKRMTLTAYGLSPNPQLPTGSGTCGGQPTTDPNTCAGVQQVLDAVFDPYVHVLPDTSGSQLRDLLAQATSNERMHKAILLLRADDNKGVSATVTGANGTKLSDSGSSGARRRFSSRSPRIFTLSRT